MQELFGEHDGMPLRRRALAQISTDTDSLRPLRSGRKPFRRPATDPSVVATAAASRRAGCRSGRAKSRPRSHLGAVMRNFSCVISYTVRHDYPRSFTTQVADDLPVRDA
jgi:hypothetical protein